MIRLVIDTSEATDEELVELEKLVPFKTQKFYFDKNNIEIVELTKEDVKIAEANSTYIKTGLFKSIILGCVPREMADYQEKMEKN